MQESFQQLEDFVAKRLLTKATVAEKKAPIVHQAVIDEDPASAEKGNPTSLAEIEFIKIEKNLAELGFFTPASKRVKNLKSKVITFTKIIDGKRVEAKVTFVPGALYGLPSTADQDKWLAFQKFVTEMQQQFGRVTNPIVFLSADMLRILGQSDSGTNFKDIDEWLDRMWSTSIISEGMVYLAGKKIRVKDRTPIKVFTRAVTAGASLDDGTTAEKNYVWLSDWQLENVNNNHQLPVDFEAYKKLENDIAKTLVPLLQIWLYATREKGVFEKRYDELCQLLSIAQYRHTSKIVEKFGPSLNELQQHGYLASWRIEKTTDTPGFKIVFYHGEKFYSDRRRRLGQSSPISPKDKNTTAEVAAKPRRPRQAHLRLQPEVDPAFLSELTKRGVGESGARKLLSNLPPDRPVLDLLEWGDAEIARQPGKIHTPAGFYIRLLEEHSAPPPTFESSRATKARQEAILAQQRAAQEQEEARQRGEEQERARAERRLAALTPEQRQTLETRVKAEIVARHPHLAKYIDTKLHQAMVRTAVLKELLQEPMDLLVMKQSAGNSLTGTPSTIPSSNSFPDFQAHLPTEVPDPE